MGRVHEKIAAKEAEKIKNNQSLLSDSDRKSVESIQAFVLDVQAQVSPFLQEFKTTQTNSFQVENAQLRAIESMQFLNDLIDELEFREIDDICNKIVEAIEGEVLNFGEKVKSLEEVKAFFDLKSGKATNLKEKLTDYITSYQLKIDNMQIEIDDLRERTYELEDKIQSYKGTLENYQNTMNVKFDVNEDFDLTKISKGKNGPEFSVIFSKIDNVVHPFILYRGKEYEGAKRQLGEGGFGKVKLAQDYETHELVAVKVQKSSTLPPEVIAKEKKMLEEMGRFRGGIQRSEQDKDYIVQELHYGKELEDTIKKTDIDDMTILEMLKQAAIQLQKMHDQNLIHRDIKLENYIWDGELKECVLIDFAFVEAVNGHEEIAKRDEAGSENYLSPEAKVGRYSKRSDIYAFGIMTEEILEKHPKLLEMLQGEIDKLKAENIEDRALSLEDIITQTNALQKNMGQKRQAVEEKSTQVQMKQETVPEGKRAKPITKQYQTDIEREVFSASHKRKAAVEQKPEERKRPSRFKNL